MLCLGLAVFIAMPYPASADTDCDLGDDVLQDIRRMLTAEDNGIFFEIWTPEEIYCACYEIYYNDPVDAFFHDRVVTGSVVLIALTGDERAVPVLIEAIDTHPSQALYNLQHFATVESVEALTANVRNEDFQARENAAEGLRHMIAPGTNEDGWIEVLELARDEVAEWILIEPETDIRDYFLDAHANLEILIDSATALGTPSVGGSE